MRVSFLTAFALCFGCTAVLDIDGEYRPASTDEGEANGGGSGGMRNTGGSATTGGNGGNVGNGGSGGAASGGRPTDDAGAPCSTGQKRCEVEGTLLCVPPDPSVGCGPTGCTKCPAPPGGYPACDGVACDFGCFPGFVKNGTACDPVPAPDSGAGGATGSGGAPGTCSSDADCPRCGAAAGCCTLVPGGTCGCNFFWCVPN